MRSLDFFFFQLSRTMALGLTQPLTEMSTKNLPGAKEPPARKADSIIAISEQIVYKIMGSSTSHNFMGLLGLLQEQLYVPLRFISHEAMSFLKLQSKHKPGEDRIVARKLHAHTHTHTHTHTGRMIASALNKYSETCIRRNRMGPKIFSTFDKFPRYTK
jgi:hypothetical protein